MCVWGGALHGLLPNKGVALVADATRKKDLHCVTEVKPWNDFLAACASYSSHFVAAAPTILQWNSNSVHRLKKVGDP